MRPWRDVKCAAVWIFQLLYMFLELFKATLPSTRFRVRNTLRLHPNFCRFTSEVTVSVKTFFLSHRYMAGDVALRQESEIIRMEIIETAKREDEEAFSFVQSQVPIVNNYNSQSRTQSTSAFGRHVKYVIVASVTCHVSVNLTSDW